MLHDVALSFSSSDRAYVENVADAVKDRGVSIFIDSYYRSAMWGKFLPDYFDSVFRKDTRFFCVVFVSEAYAAGPWTNLERQIAINRALREPSEYILVVRFDDTDILGGMTSATGYIDARITPAEEVAGLICEKIENMRFESAGSELEPGFAWFNSAELTIGDRPVTIQPFQHLLYADISEPLQELASDLTHRLITAAHRERNQTYWTTRDDRKFDRIYATASVLTAIRQTSATIDFSPLRSAIALLQSTDAGNIDDRAATVFLLAGGRLDEEQSLRFVRLLAERQIDSSDPVAQGTFLFQQGPEFDENGEKNYWRQSHRDAESFHACHIGDALLHIPASLPACRAQAEPVLDGIRNFLIRSYTDHEGWLVGADRKPTPLTLFSYALCPALRIPLPRNWRKIANECMRISSLESGLTLVRFFGVMNAVYAAWSTGDEEFIHLAINFVREQLKRLPSPAKLDGLSVPDTAALLRSVAYGVNLVDRRFDPIIRTSVADTLRNWNYEG